MTDALQVRGLTVRFGGLTVLDGLDFALAPGERVALRGPNGAGKTTALDTIGGQVRATSGRVLLDGRDITRDPPHRRARAGLSRTFQQLGLFRGLDAQANLRLAAPALRDPEALLRRFDVEPRPDPVEELPRGAQRAVALARAVALEPRVLLLDEPCAGLDHAAAQALLRGLARLDPAPAILIVEHDADLLEGFVHRSIWLGDRPVAVAPSAEGAPTTSSLPPRLEVRDLDVPAAGLTGLSFEVRPEEVLSITGPSGCGKSALAAAIAGELEARGAVRLDDHALDGATPARRSQAGLHYAPASGGLVLGLSVQDNLRLVTSDPSPAYARFPHLEARRRHPAEVLSGGERRMLALARAILSRQPVLLLDEPTTGLSPEASRAAAEALGQAAKAGAAIVRLERTRGLGATREVRLRV